LNFGAMVLLRLNYVNYSYYIFIICIVGIMYGLPSLGEGARHVCLYLIHCHSFDLVLWYIWLSLLMDVVRRGES
jgi:hypothetical protein